MKWTLLLLVMACFRSSTAVMQECNPPIPNCQCDVKVLKCNSCTGFPQTPPPDTVEFIFEQCEFPSEVYDVPYPQAVILHILQAPKIAVMDGAFKKLTNLSTLQIQGSNLLEIRPEMFTGLSKLKILSLKGNEIKMLPDSVFASMPALEQLMLSENQQLTITPGSFSELDQLQRLDLNNCGLSEIPVEAIKKLKKLKVLSLGFNMITSVPSKAFDELEDLQELHLLQNDMAELEEDALQGLDNLLELDLSYNDLTELKEDLLESSDDIQKLFLNKNKLKVLPDDLVEWSSLLELRIGQNPWTCDCSNPWMQEIHRTSTENITCASPPEVVGHDLHNVTATFDCSTPANSSTIVMAVIIPLMVICLFLIIYFVYKMIQTRKKREGQRNVRYSSVYKDTVETVSGGKKGRAVPEL